MAPPDVGQCEGVGVVQVSGRGGRRVGLGQARSVIGQLNALPMCVPSCAFACLHDRQVVSVAGLESRWEKGLGTQKFHEARHCS